jgi:hypothetical protein
MTTDDGMDRFNLVSLLLSERGGGDERFQLRRVGAAAIVGTVAIG